MKLRTQKKLSAAILVCASIPFSSAFASDRVPKPAICPYRGGDIDMSELPASHQPKSDYESQKAEDKSKYIWDLVKNSVYDTVPPFPSVGLKVFCASHDAQTFLHNGDLLPEGRKKVIHGAGTIFRIEWRSSGTHPYTGLFDSGALHGLMRISVAKPPEKKNIVPGLAIKLFVDGQASRNIMAMPGLDGQKDHNIFKLPYTTVLGNPSRGVINWLLKKTFIRALRLAGDDQGSPQILTTDHFAEVTSNGKVVSKDKIIAPYRLRFKATGPAIALFANASYAIDFRNTLGGWGKDLVLFTVHATSLLPDDSEGKEVQIGEILATSNGTNARASDEQIFFKHQSRAGR